MMFRNLLRNAAILAAIAAPAAMPATAQIFYGPGVGGVVVGPGGVVVGPTFGGTVVTPGGVVVTTPGTVVTSGQIYFGQPIPTNAPIVSFLARTAQPFGLSSNNAAAVSTPGLAWSCGGDTCSARGRLDLLTIQTCNALARQVGPINSLSAGGRRFTDAALRSCNTSFTGQGGVATFSTSGGTVTGGGVVVAPGTILFGGPVFFGPVIPDRPPLAAFQADILQPVRRTSSGLVFYDTPGLTWSCSGTSCGAQGVLARLTFETCVALAQQVGPVTAMSAAGRHFTQEAIDACNGVQPATASPTRIVPGGGGSTVDIRPGAGGGGFSPPQR